MSDRERILALAAVLGWILVGALVPIAHNPRPTFSAAVTDAEPALIRCPGDGKSFVMRGITFENVSGEIATQERMSERILLAVCKVRLM